MVKKLLYSVLVLLLLVSVNNVVYGQVFASTSFEEPAVASGVQYVDTGDPAVDHDLVNNIGEPPVDYTSVGGELGFDATYVSTGDVGLTDGDFVGVTDFTGDVGAYIDGSQGYQFQDTDGEMILTLDQVDLTGRTNPTANLFYFLSATGWEESDVVRIWVVTNTAAEIDLLNTDGMDIDDLNIEGSWMPLSADLSGFTSATLKISFTANSGAENLYIDQIQFSEGSLCAITTDGLAVSACDPATNEFSISITPSATGGSANGYTYTLNGGAAQGPFPYDTEQLVGNFTSDGMTTYDIVITDADDSNCTFTSETVTAPADCSACQNSDLIITGVYDGTLSGGQPKGVELYALNNIDDLSLYGLGSANNGGGSDGEEFTFAAEAVSAGTFIYVTADSAAFRDFFGFDADTTSNAVSINGDDAVELFCGGTVVVDVFGDINVDGTGQTWEYTDGWAYRNDGTGPDGSTFVESNWTFSGLDGLEPIDAEMDSTNTGAAVPFPIGTYSAGGDCPTNRTFGAQTVAAGTYSASNNITTVDGDVVTIASGATVVFEAQTVTLNTGFEASSAGGTTFTARVNPCTPLTENEVEMRTQEATLPVVERVKVFPNPLQQEAQIQYELSEKTEVVVAVFDMDGKVVAQLVSGLVQDAGLYQLDFNAADLPSGLYFVTVKTQNDYHVEKISVIK